MTDRSKLLAETCRYSKAWIGGCGKPAVANGLCEEHAAVECRSCGAQAVQECSYCGQFVCGTPLCADCEGYEDHSKPAGSWGFMNHSHRPKQQAESAA